MPEDRMKLIAGGHVKLFDQSGIGIKDVNGRITNLKASNDSLQMLLSNLRGFLLRGCIKNTLAVMTLDSLEKISSLFAENTDLLEEIQKSTLNIEKRLALTEQSTNIQISSGGGTSVFDFKTRYKFQIVPDFGFVLYGFQGKSTGYSEDFFGLMPYLGFNINFRPINKDIPFKLYPNKTWYSLHRFSFSAGWTLSKIAEEGKREEFFANSSLLFGLGYRVSNAVRINTGTIMFYQVDPNPVISERSLAVTPYAGISIDLDLAEYFNNVKDIFK